MPLLQAKLRHLLAFPHNLRLFCWKQLRRSYPITLPLSTGIRIHLRAKAPHDAGIAREIFAEEIYRLPASLNVDAAAIDTIADVGANIGYALLYFHARYPAARLIAFEPHPAHIACIRRQLSSNGISADLVTLHEAAAGTQPGQMFLTDQGAASSIVSNNNPQAIPVHVVDFFAALGTQRIDLMKMDIEGGEYPLLNDLRFALLNIGVLVLEAHKSSQHPEGLAWCATQLQNAGFRIAEKYPANDGTGVLWAQRP